MGWSEGGIIHHREGLYQLSHQIMGDIDDQQMENCAAGWQELLGLHFKRLVEQGKRYREA